MVGVGESSQVCGKPLECGEGKYHAWAWGRYPGSGQRWIFSVG